MDDVKDGLLFAKRIYVPRVVGTLLCGLDIAVTAFEQMSLAVLAWAFWFTVFALADWGGVSMMALGLKINGSKLF